MRLKMPAMTLPGLKLAAPRKPAPSRFATESSKRTGDVTCFARRSLMTAGSAWAAASTLDTTGIRGAWHVRVRERGGQRRDGRRHEVRVEGAGDRQLDGHARLELGLGELRDLVDRGLR